MLALTTVPAVWYVFDFENDIDPELPRVVRPTFSDYPPAAYRFAEACDTIDHVAVYVSSAALVLAVWGWLRNPRERLWLAAVALSAAGFWHAATPAPLADGWYGLGWRTIFDGRAPIANRLILAGLAASVIAVVVLGPSGTAVALGLDGGPYPRDPGPAHRGGDPDGHAANRLARLGADRLLAALVLRLGPLRLGFRARQSRAACPPTMVASSGR